MSSPTPYIDVQYLRNKVPSDILVQLTDDNNDGNADDGILESIVKEANSEVDSKIQMVTDIPVDDEEISGFLEGITGDIARYKAYLRRPPVPDDIKDDHAAALSKLKDIVDSLSGTGSGTDDTGNPSNAISANLGEDDIIFDRMLSRVGFPRSGY